MNHGKAIVARAARIRAAVTAAVAGQGCPCPGARIEELLGEEIAQYPDQIMSLDVLPGRDGFEFIGYDADFNQIPQRQVEYAPGKFYAESTGGNFGVQLVGWKPLRMGDTALAGRIRIPEDESEPTPEAIKDAFARVGTKLGTIFGAGFSDKKTCYEEAEPYKGVPFCRGNRHPGPPCKDPFCYLR